MSESSACLTEPELTALLRSYLPSSLEQQCLFESGIKELGPCVSHLTALLRAVSTYLPRRVVAPLLVDPQLGEVEGDFTVGTIMFADISGFTAMSEQLSQLGKEGAEEIAGLVNRFFTTLLEVTERYGGDLLKFGGDALLVLFGGAQHASRACITAIQMQERMARFSKVSTSQGIFRLQMTIGLGTGPLFMAHLGSNEGMEFAVMGSAMAQMAQAEDLAAAGEVFIGPGTYEDVADQMLVDKSREPPPASVGRGIKGSFYRLADFREPRFEIAAPENPLAVLPPTPTGGGDVRPWIEKTLRRIQALESFLPPGVMDKIKLNPERAVIGGEYRPVTVLFANFYGIDEIIKDLSKTRGPERAAPTPSLPG